MNNKYTCNDGLTAEFYKHFFNYLAHVVLDVYDSWAKLSTTDVFYRIGIISVIYRKDHKKRYCKLQTRTLQFLRIDC